MPSSTFVSESFAIPNPFGILISFPKSSCNITVSSFDSGVTASLFIDSCFLVATVIGRDIYFATVPFCDTVYSCFVSSNITFNVPVPVTVVLFYPTDKSNSSFKFFAVTSPPKLFTAAEIYANSTCSCSCPTTVSSLASPALLSNPLSPLNIDMLIPS